MYNFRTDLATERRDIYKKANNLNDIDGIESTSEEINEKIARCGDYFALEIKGDSMEPKMSKGDIVIVKQQNTVENGQIAIVLVNGDEATVKKVRFRDNGIELIAFNSYVYEPHFYSAKEIEELPVKIIGRVVELRAKF